jgi:hypothetical protein
MPKRPTLVPATPSSPEVMQTVSWLNKNGFRPVPLFPRSKAAVNRDYVSLDYKPPGEEFWRLNDYGVGVVTGPAHSGPVDIDLDCHEAVLFAQRFLPPTQAVFGRASKLRSHYLYRVDVSSFEKQAFIDPLDNTTIVEMRGDAGHQTVMPGSIHEGTGEPVEWSDVGFPEVTTVDAELLMKAVRKIAIATLIVRHIWAPGYHNEPAKHLAGVFFYLDWPLEEAVDVIEAVMAATGDDDKSRIPTVRATYRRAEQGKKVSGAGVLRKQLKNDALVDKLLEWVGSPTVNLLQEYNDKFAVVNLGGKFRIADTDVPPGEPPIFWSKDDWLNMMATDLSDIKDDKGRSIPKPKIWLASPRRRTYKTVDFLPGQEETSCLNLWTGWATEPDEQACNDGMCNGWYELVTEIICGGDSDQAFWLLNWLANILREPMNKPMTAPVIIGEEGAGKSLMLSYFSRILGKAFVTVTNDEHIHGRFNSHFTNALVLHSEEALYAGDKKHASVIRSLITDQTRILELKGIDARQIRNFLRLVITSNDLYSAPVKPGDRRYNIFEMQSRKASPRLVERVLQELAGTGPQALHHFLLNEFNYDPAVARTTIKNESLLALKGINLQPMESWWHDVLQAGQMLPDYLAWASKENDDGGKDDWPAVVSSVALHTAMTLKAKERGQRQIPNTTMFGLQMNKFVGRTLHKSQRHYDNPALDEWPQAVKLLDSRQSSITDMPSLKECREAFERYLGQTIEWDQIEKRVRRKKDDGPQI